MSNAFRILCELRFTALSGSKEKKSRTMRNVLHSLYVYNGVQLREFTPACRSRAEMNMEYNLKNIIIERLKKLSWGSKALQDIKLWISVTYEVQPLQMAANCECDQEQNYQHNIWNDRYIDFYVLIKRNTVMTEKWLFWVICINRECIFEYNYW